MMFVQEKTTSKKNDVVVFGFDQACQMGITRTPLHHLMTLFLFTKSDFKTIIFPQSIFAIAAVLSNTKLTTEISQPSWTDIAYRMPLVLVWLWVNLLVEDIANQRMPDSIVEDSTNKPWRPLPSRRLTTEEARSWLVVAIFGAVGVSKLLGVFTPAVSLMTLVWLYNDLEGSGSSIWLRNALNAAGLMCFSWGALEVLAQGDLLPAASAWISLTGAVVVTTVHAQDFPDLEGDLARGRSTVPILYGDRAARGSLIVMILFWSVACPQLWNATLAARLVPLGIGIGMAALSWMRWGQKWDEVVWKLWCLWLVVLYSLPAFGKAN